MTGSRMDKPERDIISAAVAAGLAAGNGNRRPTRGLRLAVAKLRDQASGSGSGSQMARELLAIIRNYPRAEEFQLIAARLLEDGSAPEQSMARWRGVISRFPHSHDAFCALLAAMQRQSDAAAARALIKGRYAVLPFAVEHLIEAVPECQPDDMLDRLAVLFPEQDAAWLEFMSRLGARRTWLATNFGLNKRLSDVGSLVARLRPRRRRKHGRRPAGLTAALGSLLDQALAGRGASAPPRRAPESVLMIAGSLGAGGGERQFVYTALGLNTLHEARDMKVRVIVRSLTSRVDSLFFSKELERAGIRVQEIADFPDYGGDIEASCVRPVFNTLQSLPSGMRKTVIKLADEIRASKPDILHIWQDGMVYNAGLAAVLAGVPRIVLSARSVPPVDRPDRDRPGYDVIYKALLAADNVSLSVNSQFAAARFAAWLGIDPDRIAVIRNGVNALPEVGDTAAQAQFERFDAATAQSALTLGTVMRLDRNKRPLLWIDAAARILEERPDARFILVGDGVLRHHVMSRAAALGVAPRLLFVGLSSCVGYWLSKMDLFLLTSDFEGLPNVLVEAQLARLPVISTPAGGALEAFIPGVTGLVTSVSPTPEEIAARVLTLMTDPERRRRMGEIGAKWAADAFSMSRMLEETLDLFMEGRRQERNACAGANVSG